jgi:uncharacterized protein
MPEYLAPGVYVEEVSFRSKSIEGVSTTTCGLIGPAAFGPTDLQPEIITGLEEFERVFGSGQRLQFTDATGDSPTDMDNYLWHAVRAFFAEGGKRMYVARVFLAQAKSNGRARGSFPQPLATDGTLPANSLLIAARFPGAAGNMRVRLTLRLGGNILGQERVPGTPPTFRSTIGALVENDVVWIADTESPFTSPAGTGGFYLAKRKFDSVAKTFVWYFDGAGGTINLDRLSLANGDRIRVVSAFVTVTPNSDSAGSQVWEVALDPRHQRNGALDSLFDVFSQDPANSSLALSLPIVITRGTDIDTGIDVLKALFAADSNLELHLHDDAATDAERSYEANLSGGNDGQRPGAPEYEGTIDPLTNHKSGLKIFEDLEDISIVAAPGSTHGYESTTYHDDAHSIINLLIIHASKMRYRIAVLDSGDNQSIAQVREMRAKINSKYAAIYYPWVRVLDPITRRQISLPPSGFVSGIYARNDTLRAVYKAPANEVVNLSLGFEKLLNKAQQEVLNPEGINCFRFFEGRGYMLWGARMATDDPEWKYVNLRRYFAYLERSIDLGTQWAVFEPNGPDLWANVTRTIESFLLNEWVNGALLGDKPEKAYFVRCDRSTMTQNDLDNGRLICLIGVAPLRPAEFVVFRIGQWTGDARR